MHGRRSYPSTGSTGDGWTWLRLRAYGAPALPSLVGLESPAKWVRAHRPVPQKTRLTLLRGKKRLYSDLGEMLFTHFGVSGPLVLSASAYLTGLPAQENETRFDLKPKADGRRAAGDTRILRERCAAPQKRSSATCFCSFLARLAETPGCAA